MDRNQDNREPKEKANHLDGTTNHQNGTNSSKATSTHKTRLGKATSCANLKRKWRQKAGFMQKNAFTEQKKTGIQEALDNKKVPRRLPRESGAIRKAFHKPQLEVKETTHKTRLGRAPSCANLKIKWRQTAGFVPHNVLKKQKNTNVQEALSNEKEARRLLRESGELKNKPEMENSNLTPNLNAERRPPLRPREFPKVLRSATVNGRRDFRTEKHDGERPSEYLNLADALPSVAPKKTKHLQFERKSRADIERKLNFKRASESPTAEDISSLLPLAHGVLKAAAKDKEKLNDTDESVITSFNIVNDQTKQLQAENKKQKNLEESVDVELQCTVEAVRYFRSQLAGENERLDRLCESWTNYKKSKTRGEDVINATLGQTQLLTSKKFKQFSGLIDRCESCARNIAAGLPQIDDGSENTKLVTAVDLEGFWSVISLQINNIDERFADLQRWMANNWDDPDEVRTTKKPKVKRNAEKAV